MQTHEKSHASRRRRLRPCWSVRALAENSSAPRQNYCRRRHVHRRHQREQPGPRLRPTTSRLRHPGRERPRHRYCHRVPHQRHRFGSRMMLAQPCQQRQCQIRVARGGACCGVSTPTPVCHAANPPSLAVSQSRLAASVDTLRFSWWRWRRASWTQPLRVKRRSSSAPDRPDGAEVANRPATASARAAAVVVAPDGGTSRRP